jgi:hypothetical protein
VGLVIVKIGCECFLQTRKFVGLHQLSEFFGIDAKSLGFGTSGFYPPEFIVLVGLDGQISAHCGLDCDCSGVTLDFGVKLVGGADARPPGVTL